MGSKTSQQGEGFWCIDHFNLMEALTQREMHDLMQQIHQIRYARGEVVFFPGEAGETVYSLRDGQVNLSHINERGKYFTFKIMGPGQVFGEAVLVGSAQRRWEASAKTDITLCAIRRGVFLHYAERNPKFALGIGKLINDRYEEFQTRVEDLLFETVDTRLRKTLLRLADEFGQPNGNEVVVPLKLTNTELGRLIGASREMTSSNVAKLKRSGLVSKRGSKMVLHDVGALKPSN